MKNGDILRIYELKSLLYMICIYAKMPNTLAIYTGMQSRNAHMWL